MSRLIVLLTGVVVAVMPATEHFWTWDRFLRGGRGDFELTLLAVLALSGLVALVANQASTAPLLMLLIAYRLKMPPVRLLFRWVTGVARSAVVAAPICMSRFRDVPPPLWGVPLRV